MKGIGTSRRLWLIVSCGLVLSSASQVKRTDEEASAEKRSERWRHDLESLRAAVEKHGLRFASGFASRGQKDFSEVYPHFEDELLAIEQSVPKLSDAEVLLRLMRLISSAHIAHNKVQIPVGMGFFNRLPFDLYWFTDGLAVTGATAHYFDAVGARVVSVGGIGVEQLLRNLEPYISYENDTQLRRDAADLICARAFLVHFRLIGDDGLVAVGLETTSGVPLTLRVRLEDRRVARTSASGVFHIQPSLARSRPGEWYWYKYLADSQTLLVQYNVCQEDSEHQFKAFAKQVAVEIDNRTVKRTVIDLRWNEGGNEHVIRPLIDILMSRRSITGPISVLVGPATFSSAVENAVTLRDRLSAKLIGERAGGVVGGYGEVSFLTLPESKIVIQFTTKRWGSKETGGGKTLEPDVPAPTRIRDFMEGRDPALELAVSLN